MKVADFRSDTVTLPSEAMKSAMLKAPLGDDVYEEDPTVKELEEYSAHLLGKSAALFAPSGTQSNLLALLSHCQRGDEYIVGQHAHTYKYEGGGAAVLGSIQPQPIAFESPGIIPIDLIKQAIKPNDIHFAKTKLISLENTCFGCVVPQDYIHSTKSICDEYKLKFHLDGARLFNASVASNQSAATIAKPFDSISICLSKGLGAPVGSVLVGSFELIQEAKRWRKMLGGGMRQAGLLAAAGIYALKNNVERLAEDHQRAQILHEALSQLKGISLKPYSAQTNMVFVDVPEESLDQLHALAKDNNIVLPNGKELRLVIHLDIDDDAINRLISVFKATYSE